MDSIIDAKELRVSLRKIVERVRQGESFTVLYRNRAAFRVVAIDADHPVAVPLDDDPLYRAEPLGRSNDGLSCRDHDEVLYGGS
jgi:antitoxin (DNA-binding transcriptional repressor) of toxin-antitoxin stability system